MHALLLISSQGSANVARTAFSTIEDVYSICEEHFFLQRNGNCFIAHIKYIYGIIWLEYARRMYSSCTPSSLKICKFIAKDVGRLFNQSYNIYNSIFGLNHSKCALMLQHIGLNYLNLSGCVECMNHGQTLQPYEIECIESAESYLKRSLSIYKIVLIKNDTSALPFLCFNLATVLQNKNLYYINQRKDYIEKSNLKTVVNYDELDIKSTFQESEKIFLKILERTKKPAQTTVTNIHIHQMCLQNLRKLYKNNALYALAHNIYLKELHFLNFLKPKLNANLLDLDKCCLFRLTCPNPFCETCFKCLCKRQPFDLEVFDSNFPLSNLLCKMGLKIYDTRSANNSIQQKEM